MDNRSASTAILKHSTGMGLLLKSAPFRLYRLMAARLTGPSFILTRFRIAPPLFSRLYWTRDYSMPNAKHVAPALMTCAPEGVLNCC
jgi:hypothetical protein